jgi:hypothetical protein
MVWHCQFKLFAFTEFAWVNLIYDDPVSEIDQFSPLTAARELFPFSRV